MIHFQVDNTVRHSLPGRKAPFEAILGSFLPLGHPCSAYGRVSYQPGSNQREGVVIILALLVGAKPRAHNKLFSWEPVSIAFLVKRGTRLKLMKGSFVC